MEPHNADAPRITSSRADLNPLLHGTDTAALQREPDTHGESLAATDRQHAAVIPGPTDVQIVEQAQHTP